MNSLLQSAARRLDRDVVAGFECLAADAETAVAALASLTSVDDVSRGAIGRAGRLVERVRAALPGAGDHTSEVWRRSCWREIGRTASRLFGSEVVVNGPEGLTDLQSPTTDSPYGFDSRAPLNLGRFRGRR